MNLEKVCDQHSVIRFSEEELVWIAGALNEVCHGLRKCDLIESKNDVKSGKAVLLLDAVLNIFEKMD
jgi:hypothetical protein